MSTIYEVLELGPIVAQNEELGLLVTINGSYLNLWITTTGQGYVNTDCRSFSETKLSELTWIQAQELAEEYLNDVLSENEGER